MNSQRIIPVNLSALERVTNLINSTLELPDLLEVIMDSAKEILNAEGSSLLLLDKEKQELNFYVLSTGQHKELIKEISIPVGEGIAGLCAQTEESFIVNDAVNDPRVFKAVDQKIQQITKNLICVPMKIKGDLVGVLEAVNSKNHSSFTEEQMEVLSYIADQAAIAINNSDLYQELAKTQHILQYRIKELNILYEFCHVVNFAINIDELFISPLQFFCHVLKVDSGLFYLFHPENNLFKVKHSIGIEKKKLAHQFKENRLLQFFQKTSDLLIIKKLLPDSFQFLESISVKLPLMIVPLFIKNQLFGLIFLWNQDSVKEFTTFHTRLITNLVAHLSSAFSNLKLQESLMEQQQIKQELKVAYLIQQKILPLSFNAPKGITIQGVSIPAEEIGGDFYDFIPIDQETFALVIADVAGKGIPAALFMALARNTIRAEVLQNPNPKNVIKRSNRLLVEDSESGIFVTGAYFLINTFNQTITYVSAGHNNQLLYRSQKNCIENLKGLGKPLGVFDETKFEEKVVFYEKDDLLVLFSDGIVEAEKVNGDQYDEWRLVEFIEKNHHLAPHDFIMAAKKNVMHFTEGNPFTDDFTLLVTRL